MSSYIAGFDEADGADASIAGGKGASLSRMTAAGLPVPRGFIVCAAAFRSFLDHSGGTELIRDTAGRLDVHDGPALKAATEKLCDFVLHAAMPVEIRDAITETYSKLGADTLVAVRSSAIGEDGEAASFAGQQETFLNVRGGPSVARRVAECWASFFTPRAMFYRAQKGVLQDMDIAVVVQEMALGEKSGVMFTVDPVQKNRDHIVIEAVWGLGEAIVSGLVTPDHFVIDREDGSVVREFVTVQPTAIVYDHARGDTVHRELAEDVGGARVLSDLELRGLREMGLRLEALFGAPQDVEWCIRGTELLLLQSRPITTL